MARAIWSGSISFGLVNVPVKLFSAVSQKEVHFNMLHDADGARISLKRFCSVENVEVPYENVVKGFEVTKGRFVVVSSDELDAADPKGARTIDIEDFVEISEIDPVYYDRTYYLAPDKGAGKAYGLLLDAMRNTKKVGIARFVLRSKQSLCCVRPLGDVLALSTMNYADEVVPVAELAVEERSTPAPRELEMAERLVASLTTAFDPSRYRDEHRDKVLALIEKKAAGEEVVAAPDLPAAKVVNLADALAASLEAAKRHPRERPAAAAPRLAVASQERHAAGGTGEPEDDHAGGGRAAPRPLSARPGGKGRRKAGS